VQSDVRQRTTGEARSSADALEPRPGPVRGYADLLAGALRGDPTTVLLSTETERLTRAEVGEAIADRARLLRAAGCGPESLVALRFEPGSDAIIAILAVLSVGAAYLPLDTRHGPDRLARILETTTPDFLLDADGLEVLVGDHRSAESRGLDDLAYVISTSGSTGTPKAPMIEQRGLVVHTRAMIELLELDTDDVVLQSAPPSFDIAVWQSTTPIVAGARTHVASAEERLDPRALWRLLERERITVAQLVPSMIRVLLDTEPAGIDTALEVLISTGEALDTELAERWLDAHPNVPIVNLYGPAECSDDVSMCWVRSRRDLRTPMPIGTAFAGASLRIIDAAGCEVPDGSVGELQVVGDLVGRGYRNDPDRTAESFGTITVDGARTRTYRTGDLAYRDPDGLLRYVGRNDFQVKVRGNRVEPGEIEALLKRQHDVRTSVVVKLDDGTDRLVAHVETETELDRARLRNAVAVALPPYMVPSAFVPHRALPLNVNGKIDRSALPRPGRGDFVGAARPGQAAASTRRLARSGTERLLAQNWGELLDLDEVPVDVDFFDLGGTSLLAVLSIDDLSRSLGFEIPTRTLITGGTIERIAASIDAIGPEASGAAPGGEPGLGTELVGLVRLRHVSAGVPLFLYPGEAASALGMVDLGRLLPADRSVYVFEPARPGDGDPPPSMAELAERCREAIATVAPHPSGSVHVGGFCMGGDVAWEIARQRAAAGEATASVTLLQTERDGVYPAWPDSVGPLRRAAAKAWQRMCFEAATARVLPPAQRRSHLRHLVVGKAIAKATLVGERRIHQHAPGLVERFGLRRSLRLRQELWARSDRRAYDGWEPAALSCPVTVVRASEQPPLIDRDDTLGWTSTGTPGIETRCVPGYHWSILHHPSVTALAETMALDLRSNDPVPGEADRRA